MGDRDESSAASEVRWFGWSSAGVALTNLFPDGRSVTKWIRSGWFVPVSYVVGFSAILLT
jgi:hypothetical protein